MSRSLLFVMLLLMALVAPVTPVAIAAEETPKDAPEATPAAESTESAPEKADEAEPASEKNDEAVKANAGAKVISGMSILGNQEAPKSLVIVPWKSSELGDSLGISTMLDDSRQPIDKEVFMRALSYYRIRRSSSH